MTRALCPAHAAAPAAATRTAPTAAPAAAAADEAMTLDELVGATAPTSPKVKVEPADQLSTWASLDELPLPTPLPGAARCSFKPGCRCTSCRTVVIDCDSSGDEFGGARSSSARGGGACGRGRGGARGGRGVPKTCRTCKAPLKGGHVCPGPAGGG
jgi:hypothetical protein